MEGNRLHIWRRHATNWLFKTVCLLVTGMALCFLAAILWSLLNQGLQGINLDLFTMSTPAPGSQGGLLNAIVGSLIMLVMAMVLALFVGVFAGTWCAEYGRDGPYAALVRFVNDVLLSAPSIIVGLFVYGIFVAPAGGFSGYAGALALALLAVPVVTRTTEDILRLQPTQLREAGVGLGAPLSLVIRKILWRASRVGMVTGGLLAFARISGEAAPLLFTALNNQFFSLDPSQPMANLPTVIFQYALSAYDDWRRLAWAGALLIAATVLVVTLVARFLMKDVRAR